MCGFPYSVLHGTRNIAKAAPCPSPLERFGGKEACGWFVCCLVIATPDMP